MIRNKVNKYFKKKKTKAIRQLQSITAMTVQDFGGDNTELNRDSNLLMVPGQQIQERVQTDFAVDKIELPEIPKTVYYSLKPEKSSIDHYCHIDKYVERFWKNELEAYGEKQASKWLSDRIAHKLIH